MPAPPSPGKGQHKFQAPKGTRDFYPADMAVRRHIENIWRQTSINHGFEEVEGPMFEHTELYTHKSGPGIVSEIFGVFSGKDEAERTELQKSGRAPYALRPEFTPTLARMVAARADALPKPIKWFAIPQHFRAERPQRGRLREFMQWNVDFIGDDSPAADAEVIAVAVGAMERFGLTPDDARVKISDRRFVECLLMFAGVPDNVHPAWFNLLDRIGKVDLAEYMKAAASLGSNEPTAKALRAALDEKPALADENPNTARQKYLQGIRNLWAHEQVQILDQRTAIIEGSLQILLKRTIEIYRLLRALGLADWIELDTSIVRGLAYYTGTVFEIVAEGERAIAGGGRYDNLIESFGGPKLPACGFGMGDVVLGLLLKEKGLLKDEDIMRPVWPDAFVISSGAEVAEKEFRPLVARLRRAGLHVRHSYKSSRNEQKQYDEAKKQHARFAVILNDALGDGVVKLKDLRGGVPRDVHLDELEDALRAGLRE